MKFNHGIHHIHKRKRAHNKGLKQFPHPNPWIKFLDKAMIVIAMLSPIMTIPQIWKIFFYQNATGVSALTWGSYVLLNVPWIIYGFVHKERIILINTILWFFINGVVTIGAILY
jgi:hypothetical protein